MARSSPSRCRPFFFVVSCWLLVVSFIGCGDITGVLSSITVSPSSVTIGINKTYAFTALGYDAGGKIVTISPTWSIRSGQGSISSDGLFTAGSAAGTTTVVVTYSSAEGLATVTVTANGFLSGRVTAPDTGNAPGIRVYLTQVSTMFAITDSAGKYTISEIPPGTYEARTRATSLYLAASSEVTIASGETTTFSPTLSLLLGVTPVPTTIPSTLF